MSDNIIDLGWGFSDSSMTPIFDIHTETIRRVMEFRNTHNIDLTEQINTAILAVVEQASQAPRLTHDGKPLQPGETEVQEFTPTGPKWVIYGATMDNQAPTPEREGVRRSTAKIKALQASEPQWPEPEGEAC